MAENLEVLATYPQEEKVGGIGEIFSDKLLVRYNNSPFPDIKDPCICPPAIFKEIERLKNFEVRDDDVFICGFPRSGTTFTQELVWFVMNNFDFETAEKLDSYNRAYWFE